MSTIPLPTRKPPVPSTFDGSAGGMSLPPLTLQGGDAGPATSGSVGTTQSIGDVFIKAGGKNTGFSFWTYAAAGLAFAAWLKWGQK